MKSIVSDDMKSGYRLFWKNGGWMTIVIAGTVIILCLLAFNAVMPVLKQEIIQNVRKFDTSLV